MIRLGITGGIGSGKTTVANFFKSKGATIFDADKQAKELIKSNEVKNILNQLSLEDKKLNTEQKIKFALKKLR